MRALWGIGGDGYLAGPGARPRGRKGDTDGTARASRHRGAAIVGRGEVAAGQNGVNGHRGARDVGHRDVLRR